MRVWSMFLTVFGLSSLVGVSAASQLSSGAKQVAIWDGSVIQVEAGELQVPESRRRQTARRTKTYWFKG